MDDSPTTASSDSRWPTLRVGLASAAALWLAQPPVGWWPLAWVAPIGWLLIARRDEPLDRGDWLRVYASGVAYWAAAVHWVCLPHPATPIGWVFLSLYLGLYPTAFVWLSRVAFRAMESTGARALAQLWDRFAGITLVGEGPSQERIRHKRTVFVTAVAAAVVWVGLEALQARLFTGFLMGSLAQSQIDHPASRSAAQLLGEHGTSALLLSIVAGAAWRERNRLFHLELAVAALLLVLLPLITRHTIDEPPSASKQSPESPSLTVAIIQGNTLATWDHDFNERNRQIMDRQTALSLEAVARAERDGKTLDLIIWPESMFRAPLDTFEGELTPPAWTDANLLARRKNARDWFRSLARQLGVPLLVGLDRFDWAPPAEPDGFPTADVYNSAALIGRDGELRAYYDKTHLVPFGEYIPLLSGVPALYFLTPVGGGMAAGDGPVPFELNTSDGRLVTIAPSICFETIVSRVIRRQVAELTDAGTPPDVLVNITNDAWFWGSAELDMHLACAQYRAAETGTPMVVAANGGLSAVIDERGRVLRVSERRQEEVLIADVPLRRDAKPTPYVKYGDWFALGCLALCGGLAILGVVPLGEPQTNTDEHGSDSGNRE